jgi:putative transposase
MLNARLQDLWRERREQTKQFLICGGQPTLSRLRRSGLEDYVPHDCGITKQIRRAMNNRSLKGRFKHVLAWVALRSGKAYLEWEEGGSTRTCHDCGFVVAEGVPGEVCEWDCPHSDCTCHHIQDENATRNGLTRTLKALALPCSGRREVSSRRVWRFNGLGLNPGAR